MKEFKYIVRDQDGNKVEGLRKASCKHDILMWSRDNNYIPVSVEELADRKTDKKKSRQPGIGTVQIANFCWQLATMMEGGISITESLETIADDMPHARFKKILVYLSECIKGGKALSDGLAEFPAVFDPLFRGMVLAGESSGSLPMVLKRLADYYDSRDKLMRKVRGALIYPIVVISFIFVIIAVMATFIIPRFRGIFDAIEGKMPVFTEVFLKVYDAIMNNMIYILPVFVMAIFGLVTYSKTKRGHEKLSRFTLSLPLFGQIILQAFIALFCRTCSALLSAGVSVLESFDILATMSKNDVIKQSIYVTKDHVVKGSSISFSLGVAKLFPNLLMKMVHVGEQTGTLPEVLDRTAEYYEKKVESMISTMTKLMEPILIVFVGGIVLVVVIALYLPIFSLSDVQG